MARLLRRASRLDAVLAVVMAMGAAATMSRAGWVCLALGLVVIGALLGVRRAAEVVAPVAIGAGIATAGLLPSLPEGAAARPAIAAVALVAGAAATWWLTGRRPSIQLVAVAALAVLLALSLALLPSVRSALDVVSDGRATVTSPDRADMLRGAADLAREEPLVGVGPGLAGFSYLRESGERMFARFAHNEYLQVWLELGLVGAAILAWGMVGTGRALLRSPVRTSDRQLWAGAVAAAVAMSAHAAVDFVWHVPVVPIVGAALLGAALPTHPQPARSLRPGPPTQRHTRSTA